MGSVSPPFLPNPFLTPENSFSGVFYCVREFGPGGFIDNIQLSRPLAFANDPSYDEDRHGGSGEEREISSETVKIRDDFSKPTGMYSRRVSEEITRFSTFAPANREW